ERQSVRPKARRWRWRRSGTWPPLERTPSPLSRRPQATVLAVRAVGFVYLRSCGSSSTQHSFPRWPSIATTLCVRPTSEQVQFEQNRADQQLQIAFDTRMSWSTVIGPGSGSRTNLSYALSPNNAAVIWTELENGEPEMSRSRASARDRLGSHLRRLH